MLSFGVSPLDLDYLIFTHCHHDHYIGLPHLLFYLRMRKRDRPDRPPLKIVGPADDIRKVIDLSRSFLQVERFPDVDNVPEVFPMVPGDELETEEFHLTTCDTIHAVQGLCYRFLDKATEKTFGFSGDTAFHPPIAEHLKGCSFIIHEASHGANQPKNAKETGHSSALEAAEIAKQAGAHTLALVHMREEIAMKAVQAACSVFPGAFWPEDGETITL